MLRRLNLIRTLYERQCEKFRTTSWLGWTQRVASRLQPGFPSWTSALAMILPICWRRDNAQVLGDSGRRKQPHGVRGGTGNPSRPDIAAIVAEELAKQRLARGAGCRCSDAAYRSSGDGGNRHPSPSSRSTSQILGRTGKKDGQGNLVARVRKCQDRLRYLKEHHADIPLWKLDLPTIDKMAAYWRNRPTTKTREPM